MGRPPRFPRCFSQVDHDATMGRRFITLAFVNARRRQGQVRGYRVLRLWLHVRQQLRHDCSVSPASLWLKSTVIDYLLLIQH